MSATLTNARTTTGLELDQRRCYSFLFFCFFVCFYYHCCYANCLLTPCFQERCHEEAKEAFFHCRCQWIIQWWVISPHQISHGDKATSLSVQSIPAVYTSTRGWNTITAITVQVFFFFPDWRHCAHVHSFWKQGVFLSTVSFWQVLFLFICILYMFTLYLALPKRETILNVLSLLF